MDDDELFEQLYGPLRRFAAVVRPDGVDPDDLVQEALVRTLAHGPLAQLDHPLAYLRTAVLRLAMNQGRRDRTWLGVRGRLVPESEPVAYPSDLDELRRLPPAERAVLYLRAVEGRPFAEIGELLGCSEQAARARASRGVRRLRADLLRDEVWLEVRDA